MSDTVTFGYLLRPSSWSLMARLTNCGVGARSEEARRATGLLGPELSPGGRDKEIWQIAVLFVVFFTCLDEVIRHCQVYSKHDQKKPPKNNNTKHKNEREYWMCFKSMKKGFFSIADRFK